MILKMTAEEVLQTLELRKQPVANTEAISFINIAYKDYVSNYAYSEITPDVRLYSYEQAANENRSLKNEYPAVAERFYLIGDAGNGDSWFIDKKTGEIAYFNHEQGEYETEGMVSLSISFNGFLELAGIYRSLEEQLDNSGGDEAVEAELITLVDNIRPGLYEAYPFKYF